MASRAARRSAHLILLLLEVAGTEPRLWKITKDLGVPISSSTSVRMLATIPSRSGKKGGLFFSSDDLTSVLFLNAHTDTNTSKDLAYCWVGSTVVGAWGRLGDRRVSPYSGCHQLCSQGLTPRRGAGPGGRHPHLSRREFNYGYRPASSQMTLFQWARPHFPNHPPWPRLAKGWAAVVLVEGPRGRVAVTALCACAMSWRQSRAASARAP